MRCVTTEGLPGILSEVINGLPQGEQGPAAHVKLLARWAVHRVLQLEVRF